ncbi:ribosome maturation factor RimP [Aeromicrobium sp.]|uniref:ribosome maturation factor RimP n=1 Tax=Aeromicrobium sp. TaxID=1871063 RepID=UPI003D6C68E0
MTDRLEQLAERCVTALGLDLEAVELSRSGSNRLLRIAVDADGGVPIDSITQATRELSKALDASDVMGEQPYTLEVTSRGVDRPLTMPRHWRRNLGRLVIADLADGSRLKGRIAAVNDDETSDGSVEVTVDGRQRRLVLSDVATARIEPELTRPKSHAPKSGAPRSPHRKDA